MEKSLNFGNWLHNKMDTHGYRVWYAKTEQIGRTVKHVICIERSVYGSLYGSARKHMHIKLFLRYVGPDQTSRHRIYLGDLHYSQKRYQKCI